MVRGASVEVRFFPPFRRVVWGVALLVSGGLGCAFTQVGVGSDYTTTCSFTGRDSSACGKCIAAKCQTQVDACCADATCRASNKTDLGFGVSTGDDGTLGKLDGCGDGKSCYDLEVDPAAKAMAACVQSACSDVCDTRLASARKATATSCEWKTSYTKERYCECVVPSTSNGVASAPNDTACGPSAGICCADLDWPAPASKCSCDPPSCNSYSGDVCICERQTGSSVVSDCARGPCCLTSEGECRCDPTRRACPEGDTPVKSCSRAEVRCSPGKRAVTTCSP